jgi:CBS domain-containing protein
MRVAQAMTPNVEIANPDDTIEHAAQLMAQLDVGALPVGENDHLIGMLTDRDITIRVAAMGKAPSHTRVRDAMTAEIRFASRMRIWTTSPETWATSRSGGCRW